MSTPFQSFWFGEFLSPYEKMCLRSFIDHGHKFHLYSYSDNLEVPSGVEIKDAAEILSSTGYFTYTRGPASGSHAAFSNLFRYKLLTERGGWWVDTDVVCLTGHVPSATSFYAFEKDQLVNGAILHFAPNDPVMQQCAEEAERIGKDVSWGELGPLLLSRVLEATGRINEAHPKHFCYEIHHSEAFDLLRPEMFDVLMTRTDKSVFLHLWNEIFRRSRILKTMLPPKQSLLRSIVDRHPVDGWTGEYNAESLENLLSTNLELKNLYKKLAALSKKLIKTEQDLSHTRQELFLVQEKPRHCIRSRASRYLQALRSYLTV